MNRMKTTIDIDEKRLKRVMELSGLKTRKAAVDYALREAECAANVERMVREAFPGDAYLDAVDPSYDLQRTRMTETGEANDSD